MWPLLSTLCVALRSFLDPTIYPVLDIFETLEKGLGLIGHQLSFLTLPVINCISYGINDQC